MIDDGAARLRLCDERAESNLGPEGTEAYARHEPWRKSQAWRYRTPHALRSQQSQGRDVHHGKDNWSRRADSDHNAMPILQAKSSVRIEITRTLGWDGGKAEAWK